MEKQYDNHLHERKAQQLWLEHNTYAAKNNPGQLYSIDTPPPTVSGALHIGHIFSYTHTDIMARYKRMSGYSVFYPFGFDDNGLPTERFVEKKLDIHAHSMKRSDFIAICLQETVAVEHTFKELWQHMGLSVDWNLDYSTISRRARKISQESFIRLYKKGYVYRKYEPALYCTVCRTSVAQAELDDVEKPSFFNDIVFKTGDGQLLVIGTTRPELLPSCVALFYNPADTRYQHLAGKKAMVPLFGQVVPIMADDQVIMEKGTGLVMCCTFGDKTDIYWFKKYNLPYRQSIGNDGKWVADTGILAGLTAHKARETVLHALKENGLLPAQKQITHAVNVHERCKKEIEYIALSQWFLNILSYKKELIAIADGINWFPGFMKARYTNWVASLGWDWCLSRQRFFGIPFPVWHCANGHIILAEEKYLPIDPQETQYHGSCPECGSTEITPDTDVMDTWNTSSLTPQICYSLFAHDDSHVFEPQAMQEFIPMSMRPQAHDIIRTWAFYTIIKSWMHFDSIPWRDIVISGHVLSDAKEKISKSKENNKIAPENLLQQYSADVIRYWTASGQLGHDVAFSENQLKIGQRLVTKIWNAFRFIHEHMPKHITEQPARLGPVNEWILHQSSACFMMYHRALDTYELSAALDAIEKFFWHDFCDNYLELIKNQLFNPDQYDKETVHATQWTLYTIGLRILQWYAPYLPHVTETIYQELFSKEEKFLSLHQTRFDGINYTFEKSARLMHHCVSLITHVRTLKTKQQLSLKVELSVLEIISDIEQTLDDLMTIEQIIKGVTQAKTIMYRPVKDRNHEMSLLEKDGVWIAKILL